MAPIGPGFTVGYVPDAGRSRAKFTPLLATPPRRAPTRETITFGATVTLLDEDEKENKMKCEIGGASKRRPSPR
jgi:hypothetical protein